MTNEERLQIYKDQLAEVNKAITAILAGAQEYTIGTRRIKRPDFGLLYEERRRLESEIQALERGTGIFHVAVFEGR